MINIGKNDRANESKKDIIKAKPGFSDGCAPTPVMLPAYTKNQKRLSEKKEVVRMTKVHAAERSSIILDTSVSLEVFFYFNNDSVLPLVRKKFCCPPYDLIIVQRMNIGTNPIVET